jgi:hypothetical protein
MKEPTSRSGDVLRGQLQERNHKGKPTIKTKSSRFDTLVARYYPAVYSFASRLTDDPREAIVLTRDAFNSTRKQPRTLFTANMKRAAVSIVVSLGLASQAFAVLRPLFPTKPGPPFAGGAIIIGDDTPRDSSQKSLTQRAAR